MMTSTLREAILEKNISTIIDLINEGADVNVKDFRGYPPLHLVARDKDQQYSIEIANLLIKAGANIDSINDEKRTAVHEAVVSKNFPIFEHLISCGALVNTKDFTEATPLHVVAYYLSNSTDKEEKTKLLKAAETLLNNKADINAKDMNYWTPFHIVAKETNVDVVKFFLKYQPDVNIKLAHGETILNFASRFNKNLEIMQLLIDHGGDVNNPCEDDGSTSLHWACRGCDKKLVKFLLKNGANINIVDDENRTPIFSLLDTYKDSAEHQKKQADVLEVLLTKWPEVNIRDYNDLNILELRLTDTCRTILLQHLAKMENLNLAVHKNLRDIISEKSDYKNYYTQCKEELSTAKSTKVLKDYSITYFNLLMDDKKSLSIYANNKKLIEYFINNDFEKTFPIYGPSIKKKMSKAIKTNRLSDDASESLKKIFPINSNPSHLILRNILSYLDKKDLKNLCELNLDVNE